jgi:hypothetical protein
VVHELVFRVGAVELVTVRFDVWIGMDEVLQRDCELSDSRQGLVRKVDGAAGPRSISPWEVANEKS